MSFIFSMIITYFGIIVYKYFINFCGSATLRSKLTFFQGSRSAYYVLHVLKKAGTQSTSKPGTIGILSQMNKTDRTERRRGNNSQPLTSNFQQSWL
jgi:hypothetical protein